MALSMEQLKAAFKKKTDQTSNNGYWDKFYPFFKMKDGEVALFRFLPDLDEDNPFGFVVENKYHKVTINGKQKTVACAEMYGHKCPMCEASRKYYDAGDAALGKTFWRKIDWIASGLVLSSPFEYKIEETDNPVRLISIGPKIYEILEAALGSGDFTEPPYDLVNGSDFRIARTAQGEYASYTTSAFARRETPVPESILNKEGFALLNLKDYRYAEVAVEQLEAMVESVLTGRSFDDKAASGQPDVQKEAAPLEQSFKAEPATTVQPTQATPAASTPTAEAPATQGSSRAQDILARLRKNKPQENAS